MEVEKLMPDVIFLMSPLGASSMTDHVFAAMGKALSVAVAQTLGLRSDQVAVYQLTAVRALNVSAVQILCVASRSEERVARLPELRDRITGVLLTLKRTNPACARFFDEVGTFESWPIMPDGSWGDVPLLKKPTAESA